MYEGSNGWQEFFFESSVRKIRYIKLYFMSNSRDGFTHLVDIQAYRYPTRSLYEYIPKFSQPYDKYIAPSDFAPAIHGLIKNRILITDNKELECLISAHIYEYVAEKLSTIYELETAANSENNELKSIIEEVTKRTSEIYSIDHELQHFQYAIHAPIIQQIKHQKTKNRIWSWLAIILTIIGIILSITDLVRTWGNT